MRYKNPIFALQKPPFCRAKVWFLTCKKGVFEMQYPLNYLKYAKNSKNTYTTATIKTTEIQIYITTKR